MNEEIKQKIKQHKKGIILLVILGIIFLILVIKIASEPSIPSSQQEQSQPVSEATEIIDYTILREWKPDKDPKAIGMEILIAEEDVSKENIINLVKSIGKNSKKALIKIFQDKEAWEGEKIGIYGEIYNKGYLVFYVKNLTSSGAYRGFNEIRWMQEEGILEDLFGEEATKL